MVFAAVAAWLSGVLAEIYTARRVMILVCDVCDWLGLFSYLLVYQ